MNQMQNIAGRPALFGLFLPLELAVPGKAQVEDNVASGRAGRLPPIPRIN
jgi:hypothetical protein